MLCGIFFTAPLSYWFSFQIMEAVLGTARDYYNKVYATLFLAAFICETLLLIACTSALALKPNGFQAVELYLVATVAAGAMLVTSINEAHASDPMTSQMSANVRIEASPHCSPL